jgi:hypothetical protein
MFFLYSMLYCTCSILQYFLTVERRNLSFWNINLIFIFILAIPSLICKLQKCSAFLLKKYLLSSKYVTRDRKRKLGKGTKTAEENT